MIKSKKLLFLITLMCFIILNTYSAQAQESDTDNLLNNTPPGTKLLEKYYYDSSLEENVLKVEYPSQYFVGQYLPVRLTLLHSPIMDDLDIDHIHIIRTAPYAVDPITGDRHDDQDIAYLDIDFNNPSTTIYFEMISPTGDGWGYDSFLLHSYELNKDTNYSLGSHNTFNVTPVRPEDHPPELHGPSTIHTSTNIQQSTETILSYFQASDYKNDDLTNNIQIIADNYSNNYNTTGTYTIVLEVEDDVGSVTEKELTIINETMEKPIISLNGNEQVNLEVGSSYNELGATAFDTDGTSLTVDITGSVNTKDLGSYTLTYSATNDEGIQADSITRTIIIEDTTPPIITLNGNHEITIEYQEDWNDPGAIIQDNYDDDLTPTITGSVKTSELGSYTLRYNAMDSSGNRAETKTRIVHVVDTIPPELSVSNLEVSTTSPLDESDILSSFSAQDNYDGDLSESISLNISSYLNNTTTPGEYEGTAKVLDSSGNESTESFMIIVLDTTPPDIIGPSIIHKSKDIILSSNFFLQYFEAHDHYDGDLSKDIVIETNDYTGNANKPGEYQITLAVSDTSNNKQLHTFTIIVVEDLLPSIIIDNKHFIISNEVQLTSNRVVDTLKKIHEISNETFVVDVNLDTYTHNYDTYGTYRKHFSLLSESGQDYTFDLTFEVIDEDIHFIEATPTFIQSIFSFISRRWWLIAIPILIIFGLIQKRKV